MDIKKCYGILGLRPGVPLYYVRQAYKELSGMCEEDITGGDAVLKQRAEKRLQQIRAAYKTIVLSNASTEKETPDPQVVSPVPNQPAEKPAPIQEPAPVKPRPATPKKPVQRPEPESSNWPKLMLGITVVAILTVAFIFGRDVVTSSPSWNFPELPELAVPLEVAERQTSEKHRQELEKRQIESQQTEIARNFDEKRDAAARLQIEAEQKELEKNRQKQKESEQRRMAETAKHRQELERIGTIQKLRVRGLLKKTGGRYVEKSDGVIVDRETGSMWTMRNSYVVLGKCVQYEDAVRYVKQLRTGGYTDWRLPDVRELSEIYVRKPAYPSCDANWFWTSEVFTQGWKKVAYIVTPNQDEVVKRQYLYLNRCGVVHAIRP